MVVALGAAATDRFHIEDFAVFPGETRTVSILLDNEEEYTAFQCDLYLPEGLSVDEDSFTLTERKSSSHMLTVSEFPGNCYRLMSYSLKVKTYSGNSGALVTFDVTANNNFGVPRIVQIKNMLFTKPSGEEIAFADESCTVSLKGDVNSDGLFDINDVTDSIAYVLGNSTVDINVVAANVYEDNLMDINDVTTLIGWLLSGISHS